MKFTLIYLNLPQLTLIYLQLPQFSLIYLREARPDQNGWIFGKVPKGGEGSFPIQKFILQILDLQTGLFEHEIDTKGSFQGMFFNNCIEKNQNKTHFKEGTSEPPTLFGFKRKGRFWYFLQVPLLKRKKHRGNEKCAFQPQFPFHLLKRFWIKALHPPSRSSPCSLAPLCP